MNYAFNMWKDRWKCELQLPCLFQFSFNVMSISWPCILLLEGMGLYFWRVKKIPTKTLMSQTIVIIDVEN
jgi:hypothetical protein